MLRVGLSFTTIGALLLAGALLGACDDTEDPGTLAFGELCTADGECISAMCNETDSGGDNSRCTDVCGEDDPCEFGMCGDDGDCVLGPMPIEAPLGVGFIYVGPVGDHGWTKAHDVGREYLEDQLGDDVDTHHSPPLGSDVAGAEIDTYIEDGDQLIIGTSFDFLQPLQNAANSNPEVNFLTCSGFQTGHNMGSYFGRMYQVMYVLGVMAGNVTQTDRIGIVGPVIIPETVRHSNAFARGVASVNPDAEVIVRWVGGWFDPVQEPLAAEELILEHGVDVIFGHTDTTFPMERVVEGQNGDGTDDFPEGTPFIMTIGYDNPDSCTVNPAYTEYCLTSGYWNWGPTVTRIAQEMLDGHWVPSQIIWDSVREDREQSIAHFAPPNANLVEASVIADMENLIADMAGPTDAEVYLPFEGPIDDAEGNEQIASGAYPSDSDLLGMCWYVDNLSDTDDDLPNVPQQCESL